MYCLSHGQRPGPCSMRGDAAAAHEAASRAADGPHGWRNARTPRSTRSQLYVLLPVTAPTLRCAAALHYISLKAVVQYSPARGGRMQAPEAGEGCAGVAAVATCIQGFARTLQSARLRRQHGLRSLCGIGGEALALYVWGMPVHRCWQEVQASDPSGRQAYRVMGRAPCTLFVRCRKKGPSLRHPRLIV
jgi:hypothetical protein